MQALPSLDGGEGPRHRRGGRRGRPKPHGGGEVLVGAADVVLVLEQDQPHQCVELGEAGAAGGGSDDTLKQRESRVGVAGRSKPLCE